MRCKIIFNTLLCICFLAQEGRDLRAEKNDVSVAGPNDKGLVIPIGSGFRMAHGEVEGGDFAREADVFWKKRGRFDKPIASPSVVTLKFVKLRHAQGGQRIARVRLRLCAPFFLQGIKGMIFAMEIEEPAARGIQLPMIGSHQSKQGLL